MIINDLDDYYIVFDTKNRNTELDTLIIWTSFRGFNISTAWNVQIAQKSPRFRSFNGKHQYLLDTNLACVVSSFYTPPCQSVFHQATSRS